MFEHGEQRDHPPEALITDESRVMSGRV